MNDPYQQPLFVSTTGPPTRPQFLNASEQMRSSENGFYKQPIYIPLANSNSIYSTPRSTMTAYSPAPITYSPSLPSTNGQQIFLTPNVSIESSTSRDNDNNKIDCSAARRIWESLPRFHRYLLIIALSVIVLMIFGFGFAFFITAQGGYFSY